MSDLNTYYPGKSLQDMTDSLVRGYLESSGWNESADRKLPLRDGEPVPWFTYAAIDFLERELSNDVKLFEYGGGNSTLFWGRRLKEVRTVDHDIGFESFIRSKIRPNCHWKTIQDFAEIEGSLKYLEKFLPKFVDPEFNERTYRSGQLNNRFQRYAIETLSYNPDYFDVIVIDGMARNFCSWSASLHFRSKGFIVFDNSERDFYRPALEHLEDQGYRKIDFDGLGPINPYGWRTSILYKPTSYSGTRFFNQPDQKTKPEVADLGICVIGYNRPFHLQATLESLRQQGRIHDVEVWIDGTQGRAEFVGENNLTIEIARSFPVKKVHVQASHLGIEKLMIDSLSDMSERFERLVVIEDDCFPLEGAIQCFEKALQEAHDDESVFSVYGHHFGVELEDRWRFPRFQGWGWAAETKKIKVLLPELKRLFLLTEDQYRAEISSRLSPDIEQRLNTTLDRNVLGVLAKFFSWDSATAFLCAERRLQHLRTPRKCIANSGITPGIGHFQKDTERFRGPPWNMVTLPEVWSMWDQSTQPLVHSNKSYGLDELDRIILDALPDITGFFIELGSHDGIKQNNSALLEANGWSGLLIEALPAEFARCIKARPNAIVEHAACVSASYTDDHLEVIDAGLMSVSGNSTLSDDQKKEWLERARTFTSKDHQKLLVPARTLSSIIEKHAITQVDLLILDVEGAEIDVLNGLDFDKHAPRFIVAEDHYNNDIAEYLKEFGYSAGTTLLERRFTRDRIYQLD